MKKYLSATEYAELHGLHPVTIRQRCARGAIPGAIKIGARGWCIPEDAPLIDNRISSGKYVGVPRKRNKQTGVPIDEYKRTHPEEA